MEFTFEGTLVAMLIWGLIIVAAICLTIATFLVRILWFTLKETSNQLKPQIASRLKQYFAS